MIFVITSDLLIYYKRFDRKFFLFIIIFCFFDDDEMQEYSKITWHNSTTRCALLLRASTLSVGNPLPLLGTKRLHRQNPSRCDVQGVMKQTPLLPHKTASRPTGAAKLAPLSCARWRIPPLTWPWPTGWWKNGSLLITVLPPRPRIWEKIFVIEKRSYDLYHYVWSFHIL